MATPLAVRPDDRAGPRPGGSSGPGLIPLTRWGQVLAAHEKQLHRNNDSAAPPSRGKFTVGHASYAPLPGGHGLGIGHALGALHNFLAPGWKHPAQGKIQGGVVVPSPVGGALLKLALLGTAAKPVSALVGHGSVPGKLLAEGVQAATGAPAGAYQLLTHPVETGRAVGQQYGHTYGPLAHGHLGEFAHRVGEYPLGPLLDLATLATGGALAAEKAGALKVPTERALGLPGTEGHVQPFASPNPLTRAVEHRFDRLSEAHPETPVVGALSRISRRIPFEAERNFERQTAAGIPFMLAERKLGRAPTPRGKALRVAYDVMHGYGHDPKVATKFLDAEVATRQAKLADESTPLLEKAHQFKTVKLLQAARKYVENPPPKLVAALREGKALAEKGQEHRIEMGQVSPEAAAERVNQRARLVTGATYREGRLSRTLVQTRRDVEALQARVDKLTGRRDQQATRLLTREQARALKSVAGKPIPHDIGSAQEELARLEKFHEAQIGKLIEARVGKFSDLESRRETMVRNQMRRGYGKPGEGKYQEPDLLAPQRGRQEIDPKYADEILASELRHREGSGSVGGVHVPTLKEEARAHVEQELEQAISRNPNHPAVRRITQRVSRIQSLREGLRAAQDIRHGMHAEPRELTAAEASKLLGHREAGKVPEQLGLLRTALKQAQQAGDSKAEAKIHGALDRLGYSEPAIVGSNVLARGKVLQPRYSAELERVGGALSVAKDRLARLEQQHVNKYGFLPEQTHVLELQGGENAGAGAAYVGDRANRSVREFVGRARSVTGKRPKEGYERRSQGILFTEGRATRTSKNVLRDFTQTAKSLAHKQDVETARGFTKPLNEKSPTLLDKGHMFYNPEGVKIPRRYTETPPLDELEQMLPQDMQAAAMQEYRALMDRVFPDEKSNYLGSRQFKEALQRGEVRQIPVKVKEAFEGGAHIPTAGTTGLGKHVVSLLDLSNNITRDGLLYLKGSFAPLNFGGNVVFGTVQQGVWFPYNLAKAASVLGDISHENLVWLDHEVGSGAALSLVENAQGPLGRSTRRIAHVQNVLADLLPRRAAIIHELAQKGYKTDAQITQLRLASQAGGPRATRILNQAAEQAEKAMVQFRGQSPFERRVVSRAIFIYPWMKGATKYLGRLPLDRPFAADVVGNLGQQGSDDTKRLLGQMVSYLDGIVPTGKVESGLGAKLLKVRNPAAITPFQTGAQSLQILEGLVSKRDVPATYRVGSLLQPSLQGLLGAAFHTNLQTGHAYPGDQGFLEILKQTTVDQFAVANAIKALGQTDQTKAFTGSPASQKLYVQRGGWKEALRIFFEGGARTRLLNVPAEQAKQHAEVRATMNAEERAKDDIVTLGSDLVQQAKSVKLPILDKDGKLLPGVADAVAALGTRKLNRLAYAKQHGIKGRLGSADELAADSELLVKQHQLRPDQVAHLAKWAASQKGPDGEKKIQRVLDELGAIYFHRGVLSLVQSAFGHKGVRLKVPSP